MLYHTPWVYSKHSVFFSCKLCGATHEISSFIELSNGFDNVLWRNMLSIRPETSGKTPFSFSISALGSGYVHYTKHRTKGHGNNGTSVTIWTRTNTLLFRNTRA